MSIVSNVHSFVKLTKDAKPMMDQRLVRLIAKGENKHANLAESLAVSIPRVDQEQAIAVIDRLIPHVVGMVQDAQDKIIREWRIEHGRDEIPESVFSVDECVAWLDANAAGDRVSAEYLTEWFGEEYMTAAQRYISEALGVDIVNGEVPEIVQQKCNVLRDMFTGFASPKYSPAIPKLRAMIKFTKSVRELDARMSAIETKCVDMLARKEKELSEDALGF